jgi:undecaprenyl-diphosphatase
VNLRTAGSSTARSADTLDHRRHRLAPLVIVTVAALVFAILLVLVRLQWAPLESADHGAAADINSLIAGNATLVAVVKAVTWLGSGGVLWTVIGAATIILALRRRFGVHYLSDVVGAWAVGVTWLGVTAFAFELARSAAGLPVTEPVSEGLEPEARADLKPARPEPSSGSPVRQYGRTAAAVVVAWVLILGIIVGLGELITKDGNGDVLGDRTIPHWFAAHRTPGWTQWSQVFSTLGATQAILIAALATCVVFLAVTRRWRPVVFVAGLMLGELGTFLVAAAVVKRPRPDVTQLDHHLPTSAYPSGHEAATCCLYIAIAILVIGHARGWWRWLFLLPAIAMPVLVALSRLYRGEHHPTDLLASLLFSALWLTAATVLIKPDSARKEARREEGAG